MRNMPEKGRNNDGTALAVILITIGLIWLFVKTFAWLKLNHFYMGNIFFPFQPALHNFRHFIFSWPAIFIIVGLVLMAGRRNTGIVLIVIGGIFLIPKIIHVSLFSVTFLLPVLLIGTGIVLIAKVLTNRT